MGHVTAVLNGHHDQAVWAAAAGIGSMLGLDVERRALAKGGDVSDLREAVVRLLRGKDVEVGVLGVDTPAGGCWEVLPEVAGPVLVVPARAAASASPPARVLVPLDGTAETAASVSGMVNRLIACGAEVLAVHVFVPATVPAFWDQAAHSHASWTAEFLRRNLPAVRDLGLRRGEPATEVLAEATAAGVDLVLLGWSQNLDEGKAQIVRECLTHGSVPVLLVRTAHDVAGGDLGPGGGDIALSRQAESPSEGEP